MIKRVFISRSAADCNALSNLLRLEQIEILALSLIETSALPFDANLPKTDWIFFSSSNAVRYFFEKKPILSGQKLGAIGRATADTASTYLPIDFEGEASDIADSAARFAEVLGSQTVLFPMALKSLQHVQSVIAPHQVINLPVYQTQEKEVVVPTCNAYVFSSPSNVRAFFKSNSHVNGMPCIAYGNATQTELETYGVDSVKTPKSLDTNSIARTIIQVLRG